MVGGAVSLPCNMTSSVPGDQVRLVLWFRSDKMTPVYSLDSRGNIAYSDENILFINANDNLECYDSDKDDNTLCDDSREFVYICLIVI